VKQLRDGLAKWEKDVDTERAQAKARK
jgi:hypothetical protein